MLSHKETLDLLPKEAALILRQNALQKSWHLSEHHPGSTDKTTPNRIDETGATMQMKGCLMHKLTYVTS